MKESALGCHAIHVQSLNRRKAVGAGGQSFAWEYDGLDRRVEERVNGVLAKRFVWDGTQIVQERAAKTAQMLPEA